MESCLCCFEPCERVALCLSTYKLHKGYFLCRQCESEWARRTERCMVCNQEPLTNISPCAFVASCCFTAMWGAFTLYALTWVV